MNINIEFTVKVKASDDTSKPSSLGPRLPIWLRRSPPTRAS